MPDKIAVENILPMSNAGGEKLKGQPEVILNMDSFANQVDKRQGRTLLASLSNCHSLKEVDDYFLAGGSGGGFPRSLFKVDLAGNKTELAELPDLNRVHYLPVGDKVYLSSKTQSLVYNKLTRATENWGVDIPEFGPDVTIVGGGLPPGKYHICFTRKTALGELSGAGPVTVVDLSVAGGVHITNKDSDFLVWITEANGVKFFLAGNSSFIQKPTGIEVLPTLDVTPPGGLENLIFFRGRIWGSKNDKILYSDSYAFSWFRPYNAFQFNSEILMLAEDANGVYIGTETDTYYQTGDNIREMSLNRIGAGVIKGALVYAPVGPADIRVPVWASSEGIFSGVGGEAVSLTDEKVNIELGKGGAAFYNQVKGNIQLGVNAPASGAGISDKVSVNVFREGRLINATYNEAVRDNVALSGETTET